METLNQIVTSLFDSFNGVSSNISEVIPNIIGAVLVLILGWVLTRFMVYLLKRLFKFSRIDNFMENLKEKEVFGKLKLDFQLSKVLIGVIKFVMLLIVLTVALEILSWTVISKEISNLLRYLPKLFSAILLFSVGLYIANFVKKAIAVFFSSFDLIGSKIIGHLVYYIIVIIITITSLNQAEIDTTIITNNLTLVLGAFLLAFAIAFGLGSKDVIQNLLFSFYFRKNYEIGQRLTINKIKGEIISIDNICMTLKTDSGKIVIPIKEIVESKVEIED